MQPPPAPVCAQAAWRARAARLEYKQLCARHAVYSRLDAAAGTANPGELQAALQEADALGEHASVEPKQQACSRCPLAWVLWLPFCKGVLRGSHAELMGLSTSAAVCRGDGAAMAAAAAAAAAAVARECCQGAGTGGSVCH